METDKKPGFGKTILYNLQHKTGWQLLVIVMLPLIIYTKILSFEFVGFDDNGIILNNMKTLSHINNIGTSFKTDAFFNKNGDFYRPIQNVSFFLDASVSKEKPWMYHLTNLIIHLLTCVSLYFFLQFLDFKRLTAFLVTLLFAVHPLFASDLAWVPSRGDILIGLLGILLFMSFGKYFKTGKFYYFIIHALLFFLIIFTKETTVLFPLFCLYYYFLVLKEKFSVKKLLPFFILWGSIFGGYFFLRKHVVLNTATVDVFGLIPFFKNNPVIPTITGQFFLPFNLSSLPLYNNTATIVGIAFLILIIYLTFEYTRERKWLALMGLGWFLLFVIPPTIYRLDNADCFFTYLEHRTYLPIIGLIMVPAFFIDEHLNKKSTPIFLGIFIAVLGVFSFLASSHANDYKNNFSFGSSAARSHNPSGYSMVAGYYIDKGKDTVKALENINKAIELCPKPEMYMLRGKLMAKMQMHAEAEQDYSLALDMAPNYVEGYLNRAIERRYLKKYESAFRDIYTAAKYDPNNPKVYFSFGNLFLAVNNYNEAISSYTKAITLQPSYGEAYNNRAYVKLLNKDYKGTIEDGNKARLLIPKNAIVYDNLGQAYRELNELDSALVNFNKAITINGNFGQAYFERGRAKQKQNDLTGACADWSQALKLNYKDTTMMIEKYCK